MLMERQVHPRHGLMAAVAMAANVIYMRDYGHVPDLYADDPRRAWGRNVHIEPTLYHSRSRNGRRMPGFWPGDGVKPAETRQMRRHPTKYGSAKRMPKYEAIAERHD